jgi:restriction endonuclease Mrr
MNRDVHDRPTVPVFYHIPPEAAERAIERFRRAQANADRDREVTIEEYLYEEIDEQPVMYVGGEPLDEYASDRVDDLVAKSQDDLAVEILETVKETDGPLDLGELQAAVGDVGERELEKVLSELQRKREIRFSGHQAGVLLDCE